MIARALGCTVAELNERMTPAEYMGWRYHFERYPHLEEIIAYLWYVVASFAKEDVDPHEMGYWIESPKTHKARVAAEELEKNKARAAQIAAAFKAAQGNKDG